jgi:hypothetical protein
MSLRLFCCFPMLAALVLVSAFPEPILGQAKVRYPRIHSALHELREARKELSAAKDTWPPGNRDRALASIDQAIQTVKIILAAKNEDFRGLDRNPDYYKRYSSHPRLRAAMDDLRDAREELRLAAIDPTLQERALLDIDIAIGAIAGLIRR